LRSEPKLKALVEKCSEGTLNTEEFPFIEEPKNTKKKNVVSNNRFGGKNNEEDMEEIPNLYAFVIGGIAHNEISSLENSSLDHKLNHKLFIGSTSIITAKDYINELMRLPSPKKELDIKTLDLKSINIQLN